MFKQSIAPSKRFDCAEWKTKKADYLKSKQINWESLASSWIFPDRDLKKKSKHLRKVMKQIEPSDLSCTDVCYEISQSEFENKYLSPSKYDEDSKEEEHTSHADIWNTMVERLSLQEEARKTEQVCGRCEVDFEVSILLSFPVHTSSVNRVSGRNIRWPRIVIYVANISKTSLCIYINEISNYL